MMQAYSASCSYSDMISACMLQMGGPEGVRAAEQYTLVTGLRDGMWVIAEPRWESHDPCPEAYLSDPLKGLVSEHAVSYVSTVRFR